MVLETPPHGDTDWQLARFTSLPTGDQSNGALRGRPQDSGVFENRQTFLDEVSRAVYQVRSQGNRVTQERVAGVLSQRAFAGSSDPVRQLRRWTGDFGYNDWRDLLNRL